MTILGSMKRNINSASITVRLIPTSNPANDILQPPGHIPWIEKGKALFPVGWINLLYDALHCNFLQYEIVQSLLGLQHKLIGFT